MTINDYITGVLAISGVILVIGISQLVRHIVSERRSENERAAMKAYLNARWRP